MLAPELVASRLGFAPGSEGWRWVAGLAEVGAPPPPLAPVPLTPEEAARRLAMLKVSDIDASDVLATLPSPDRTPEWWWCLEREVHLLAATMGDPDAPRGHWPSFEGQSHGLERRCHLTQVALAVMPFTLGFWSRLGVPEEIAVASLSDVGRHMDIHRRVHGVTGIDAGWWVTLCLRAEIVDLGRLQYARYTLGVGDESPPWYPEPEAIERGPGFLRGDACIGVHIPEGGPLGDDEVEQSLLEAGSFFSRYFPVASRRLATCWSWLLDDQLAEYLPASSNIVKFQRRFELVPGGDDGDENVLRFVFRASHDADLAALPQTSTLERAAVAHIASGRHWMVRTGWLDLPGDL